MKSNSAIALANTGTGFVPFNGQATSKLDWFGTTRGRLGVLAAPTWLLYGTGGVAYGAVKRTWTQNFPTTGQLVAGANTQDAVGWTAGAGTEWMFAQHWTVGLEYLYIKFEIKQTLEPPDLEAPAVLLRIVTSMSTALASRLTSRAQSWIINSKRGALSYMTKPRATARGFFLCAFSLRGL